MRILGIDPGLNITGYGCVDARGEACTLVEAGVFRLGRDAGAGKDARSISARLGELDADLRELIGRLRPGVVAVESLFAHYKHPATAISMGHARGVILLAVRSAGLELREYKPNEVKKSLTGHGHADKARMQRAIQARFGLAEPPRPPDVADALAIALCAAGRLNSVSTTVGGASLAGVKAGRGRRPSSADLARLMSGRSSPAR